MSVLEIAGIFVLGAAVGSFLNVLIYRLPRGESIVRPRSRCTSCGHPLGARDLIPIVSWVLQRGRCRHCRAAVSARYAIVEALTGVLAVLAVVRFGEGPAALAAFGVTALLLVVVFTDLEFQIIPNEVVAAALVIGVAGVGALPVTARESVIGALLGALLLGGLAFGYRALTGRDGMGGGDVKLAFVLGIVLGWAGLLVTLFLASLAGTLLGLVILLARRQSLRTPLPFGVFLAPAATLVLLVGPQTLLKPLPGMP